MLKSFLKLSRPNAPLGGSRFMQPKDVATKRVINPSDSERVAGLVVVAHVIYDVSKDVSLLHCADTGDRYSKDTLKYIYKQGKVAGCSPMGDIDE